MSQLNDTTAEHPPIDRGTATSAAPDSFLPDKRVIEESGALLATETRWLLQQRLRAASLVLVVGFGLFFVRSLILRGFESLAVLFHGMMLVLLLVGLGALSSRWKPALRRLRTVEVTLFTLIIVFFMAAQYVLMLRGVRGNDPVRLTAAVKSSVLWMLAMIFTYAIFIPNHWRRAAKLIVPMALAPMAVPWILGLAHPELYEVAIRAASLEKISEDGLFLLLGAFTAIFGTHIINTLRTEAYEARQLNQYRLGRKLGGGGMGDVFLAEHQLLKRPCAIKLIRRDLVDNPRVFARFEREVRATARLSHWNTIEIFDYGRNDDGAFYYVMEYLPGLSLAELVQRHGPMPPARVIYLLRQACDALNEAHDSGLIHRDIKPANLMAAYRGGQYDVCKLLDFGLVKTLRQDESVHLSQEGAVAGSPLYMAPEQVMHSQPPDRRTDIYGLGSVAYFILTGRPPFLGDNAMAVMVAHARDPVTPPSQIRADIPADLERIVLRCLAKKPADRYPDTPSLAQDLEACADAHNWSPRHAAQWWRAHPGPGPDEITARLAAIRDPLADENVEPTTAMAPVTEPRPM
ncbi:MAG: serine/threonine-protein kinase [Isosphaerales bacterium]